MLRMRFRACALILIAVGCVPCPESASAQNGRRGEQPPVDDVRVLQALLKELRELRIAIEGANLIAYRAQITLERMKFQQTRVDRVAQQLEEAREDLSGADAARQQLVERIRELETQVRAERDDERRQQFETELKDAKVSLEQQVEKGTQLQERQAQLNAQLQVEQTRLDELLQRLKALESDMEPRRQTEKANLAVAPGGP